MKIRNKDLAFFPLFEWINIMYEIHFWKCDKNIKLFHMQLLFKNVPA